MDRVQRSDDHTFAWTDLHGGRGAITVRRYFEGSVPWPVEVETWELPVGGSEGLHRHDAADPDGYAGTRECYLVVDGTGRFTLGPDVVDVGPGDAVLVDPQTDRGLVNTGDHPLRLVALRDPPATSL